MYPSNIPVNVGFSLWLLRQARGLTQQQVATRMRTTRQHVGELEAGQCPKIPVLLRCARALEVSPCVILVIQEQYYQRAIVKKTVL